MLQRNLLIRFTVLMGIYATVLLIPWGGVERSYAAAFRIGNDVLFSRFWCWSEGCARFLNLRSATLADDIDLATPGQLPRSFEAPRPDGTVDTLVLIMNRAQPSTFGQFRISSRLTGYWPTAWFLALVLAKPMPWRRRGWAMVWGLGLIHAFIAFRLSLRLLNEGFASSKVYALFHPSELGLDVLRRLEEVFVQNPTVSFAVPTVIWFIVAFQRAEWAALRQTWTDEGEGS